MSASQQPLRIDIGHAAGGGNVHVAADQDRAHGRAGLKRLRLLVVAHRSRTHDRDDSRRGKLSREKLNRLLRESVEHQRSLDRLQVIRKISSRGIGGTRQREPFAGRGSLARNRSH